MSAANLFMGFIALGQHFINFDKHANSDTSRRPTLSIHGEIRSRYERYWNDNWGEAPKDGNGYFLHRFLLGSDLRLGNSIHFIMELKSALHSGLDIPPRPVDEDQLDFQLLMLQVNLLKAIPHLGICLRAGRQELEFGSRRLINKRSYTNALLSFDGLSIIGTLRDWSLTLMAVKQSRMSFGIFDNKPDPDRLLWGSILTGPVTGKWFNMDIYYIGEQRRQISYDQHDFVNFYDQGPYRDTRHTIGLRLFGSSERVDYDIEPMYQFGSYSRNNTKISAWRIAAGIGDSLRTGRNSIRLYANADVSSGDHDSSDHRINTFLAPYPDIPDPSCSNLSSLTVGVQYFLEKKISIDLSEWLFRRTSTADGIHGFLGFPYRPAGNSGVSYIGNSPILLVKYNPASHVSISFLYATEFVGGGFLQYEPPGKNLSYGGLAVSITY